MVQGLRDAGLDVVDIGIVPTPLAYWAQHKLGVAGGIQITGSHNPPEFNGFKLGLGNHSIYGADIQHIYDLAVAGRFPTGKGKLREQDVIGSYVEDVGERIGRIAKPIKCVVDCGNGAGALVAKRLFERIGLSPTILFGESDGIIWGDHILIIYARDVLVRTGKGQPIIFDVKCSQALPEEVEKAGGKPLMWKTGHSLIEEKMHETNAPIAGEMSGHMFFAEGWYGFDDAMYGAARLLRIVADTGKSVREMMQDVPKFVATPEIRVDCPDDQKFGVVEAARKHFSSGHDVIDVDGVRVLFGDGWGLIRASNTQPVLVLRFEARTAEHLDAIRSEMEGWLRDQGVTV
jgi:phosphomannomutase/phosphoglucomutase